MTQAYVGTNLKIGDTPSPIDGVTVAVTCIVGVFEKGTLNERVLVTSWGQFVSKFGSKPAAGSTAWYAVKAFFAKAGSGILYIVRVASSTAAKATASFDDRQGTPAATLNITAKNEGSWGNFITVDVDDHNILTTKLSADISASAVSAALLSTEGIELGTYLKFDNSTNQEYVTVTAVDYTTNIVQWTGGLTNAYTAVLTTVKSLEFTLKVYYKGSLVETWEGLSMNDSVSNFVETSVNSDYIICTDAKASDTDYTDQPVALSSPKVFASGADGISDVLASDYQGTQNLKTGLYAMDDIQNLFRFAVPAPLLTDVDAAAALLQLNQSCIDYARTRVTTQFYMEVPYNKTPTEAVTWGNNFAGREIACFYPWLKVIENGATVWIPPTGAALGVAVEKDYRRGVHKSIGNELVPYAIGLRYHVSRAEGEILNDAGINTIRAFAPGGIKIYGGRTKSNRTIFRFIDQSEYWNYVGLSLEIGTQDVPFELNDETLWKGVERRIGAFLANEQQKRALFDADNPGGQAWSVIMNKDNNPSAQVALGYANVAVTYSKTGTAEKFIITLTPTAFGLAAS